MNMKYFLNKDPKKLSTNRKCTPNNTMGQAITGKTSAKCWKI